MPDIDLARYYTAQEAAEVLSRNSGKAIDAAYVRQLVVYKKISNVKLNSRFSVYPKEEIDSYVVESRGVKSAQAAKSKAKGKQSPLQG